MYLNDSSSGSVKNNAVGPAGPAPAGSAPAEMAHQPAQLPQDATEMAGGPPALARTFTETKALEALFAVSEFYGQDLRDAVTLMRDDTFWPGAVKLSELAIKADAEVKARKLVAA